jgi:hypothetical protein
MAKEIINLTKTIYDRNQYSRVINTQFTQLAFAPSVEAIAATTPSINTQINQFFSQYQKLFFDIPKLGQINSHEYLIQTSKEYIGGDIDNPLIASLTSEIDQLREQNSLLQKQLLEISNTQLSSLNLSLPNDGNS